MMLFCLQATLMFIIYTSFVFIAIIISRNDSSVTSFIFIICDNLRLSQATSPEHSLHILPGTGKTSIF